MESLLVKIETLQEKIEELENHYRSALSTGSNFSLLNDIRTSITDHKKELQALELDLLYRLNRKAS